MKFLSVVLAGLSLMFVSCGNNESALLGNWKTISYEKDGVGQPICESEIIFEKGEGDIFIARGNSGVNSFNGEIQIKGKSYKASENFASTKMMGDETSMEFENAFLECLITADYYEVKNDVLIIGSKANNTFLKFGRNG